MPNAAVEERLDALETEVAALKQRLNGLPPAPQTGAELARAIAETYQGIPVEVMEEAARLGREAMKRGVPDEE